MNQERKTKLAVAFGKLLGRAVSFVIAAWMDSAVWNWVAARHGWVQLGVWEMAAITFVLTVPLGFAITNCLESHRAECKD